MEGVSSAEDASAGCSNCNKVKVCHDVPVNEPELEGEEWGCADTGALENRTVSWYSWHLKGGTAIFLSFSFNLWFECCGDITKQPHLR